MDKLVSLVIVTWNNQNDIIDCLASVQAQDYPNFEVVLVDNASSDSTVDLVRTKFPEVKIIASKTNHYFAGGNNIGINFLLKDSNPKFIGVLNPDTILAGNWISSQVAIMESSSQIGIIGPKVVFEKGFGVNEKVSTADQTYINTVGILPGGYLFPYDRGYAELDQGQYDKTEEVYAVSGVSMLIRSEVIKQIGGFYKPMQMYLEDVDLCIRAKKAGWSVIYTGDTTVRHKHMQSTHQAGNQRYLLWSKRNYLYLVSRHYGLRKLIRAIQQIFLTTPITTSFKVILSFLLRF